MQTIIFPVFFKISSERFLYFAISHIKNIRIEDNREKNDITPQLSKYEKISHLWVIQFREREFLRLTNCFRDIKRRSQHSNGLFVGCIFCR